jgi:hypothetical protein
MMEYDEAITLFLDVTGAVRTSIDFNELFGMEVDEFTIIVSYALKVDWRINIAGRVHDDLLINLPTKYAAATSAHLVQNRFTITRGDDDDPGSPCLHLNYFVAC